MNTLVALFTLAPVLKGFIAMVIAGASFPLCGVMVLRLNLIPMRYMLMHGVILGGAIALAFSLPIAPVTAAVNCILVFLLLTLTKDSSMGFGAGSAATMVLSMALASVVMHVYAVPAKDTLSLLWGSPFALTTYDIISICILSILLVIYIICNARTINALFFNQDVARSMGIKIKLHYTIMVLLVALVIAVAMKILGALLIDALLLLPVMIAGRFIMMYKRQNGIRKLFIISSVVGCVLATGGYVIAVITNLPPSGAVALFAGVLYFVVLILNKINDNKIS
jgi:zinc transport system permease protein